MQPYLLQILFFIGAFWVFNNRKIGLRYFALFCLPFYSMPLLQVSFGSTYIRSFQILVLCCFVWLILNNKPLLKEPMARGIALLLPFILSIIYNLFFFTPIEVWVINNRQGVQLLDEVTGLTMTNFTQFIYLLFGALSLALFASLDLNAKKLRTVLEYSMWAVSLIGLFQIIAYYLNVNFVFRALFSVLENDMADQLFIWGLKRVSSTFSEPSYFAQYSFYTLLFYLTRFGYQNFKNSKAVWALFLTAVISTSTTAYWGLSLILMLTYFRYSSSDEKMLYYVLFIILLPPTIYLLGGFAQEYWSAKESSSTIRTIISWDLPVKQIPLSPFFGFGYGTSKPLFIHTQMVHAIGFFGVLMFILAAIYKLGNRRHALIYLTAVAIFGIGNFELSVSELWVYFGLLLNPYLNSQLREQQNITRSKRNQFYNNRQLDNQRRASAVQTHQRRLQ